MSDIVLLVKDMWLQLQCVCVNVWLCECVNIIVNITNSASASSCQ